MRPNERCWCGSGKKYKKCHWMREYEDQVTTATLADVTKSKFAQRYCSVPSALKPDCHGDIVQAHTVSKSSSLKRIARDGHVYAFKTNLHELHRNDGRILPKLLGINKASTFTGFCKYHDASLFSPIETDSFNDSKEHCFLVAYRTIAREFFTKSAAYNTIDTMRTIDRGRDISEQIRIQDFIRPFAEGTHNGLKHISGHKTSLDSMLCSGNYQAINAYIINLDTPPPVMCSGAIFPEVDFAGNTFDNLANASTKQPDVLHFSSFSTETGGKIVFSWLKHDLGMTSKELVDSLNNLHIVETSSALMRFFFEFCENLFISPNWWDGLSYEVRESLIGRVQSGASPLVARKHDCLVVDNLPLENWCITNRIYIV